MSRRFFVRNTFAFWAFEIIGGVLGLLVGGVFQYPVAGFCVGGIIGALTYVALDSRFSSVDDQ
jgi:uncharacterized membrane protein